MSNKLPVGSIIRIKNKKQKYLIIGKNIKNKDIIYDYMCEEYPYGILLGRNSFYYQDEDVKSLCFLGNINDIGSEKE